MGTRVTHLTGVHVWRQLEPPTPVTVAGVAARGVDTGLLTASLLAFVHICWTKEHVVGMETAPNHALSTMGNVQSLKLLPTGELRLQLCPFLEE